MPFLRVAQLRNKPKPEPVQEELKLPPVIEEEEQELEELEPKKLEELNRLIDAKTEEPEEAHAPEPEHEEPQAELVPEITDEAPEALQPEILPEPEHEEATEEPQAETDHEPVMDEITEPEPEDGPELQPEEPHEESQDELPAEPEADDTPGESAVLMEIVHKAEAFLKALQALPPEADASLKAIAEALQKIPAAEPPLPEPSQEAQEAHETLQEQPDEPEAEITPEPETLPEEADVQEEITEHEAPPELEEAEPEDYAETFSGIEEPPADSEGVHVPEADGGSADVLEIQEEEPSDEETGFVEAPEDVTGEVEEAAQDEQEEQEEPQEPEDMETAAKPEEPQDNEADYDENSLLDDAQEPEASPDVEPEPQTELQPEPEAEPEPRIPTEHEPEPEAQQEAPEPEPSPEPEQEPEEPKPSKDYSGATLDYDFTSGERYVDRVSTKTEFDKMLDELSAISKDLLSWEVEKFAKKYTDKFQDGEDSSVADERKFEAFLGGYITNAAMLLYDIGYRSAAIKQLEQAKNILVARKKLEDETAEIKTRVEEEDASVDLSDILGLFGDG